jgi:hypothetical protein
MERSERMRGSKRRGRGEKGNGRRLEMAIDERVGKVEEESYQR